jgi:hypothetical protein
MDRRKRDYDNKESFDRLNALKDVFENLADSQKRIAEAMEARNQTEKRKVKAIEVLAENIIRMLDPNFNPSYQLVTTKEQADSASGPAASRESREVPKRGDEEPGNIEYHNTAYSNTHPMPDSASSDKTSADRDNGRKSSGLTNRDQQILFPIIDRMREGGDSWERIARHIAEQGYPTVSGKGIWRGVMVKNLYEKISE